MYDKYAEIRDSLGLTDYAVAKGAGVGRSTISDWKTGAHTPNLDNMSKIASFLGVSVEFLMTGKNTEKESTSGEKYYFSDEAAEMAQSLYENMDMRVLFDAARGARPDDIKMAADMLKRFKETNPDG